MMVSAQVLAQQLSGRGRVGQRWAGRDGRGAVLAMRRSGSVFLVSRFVSPQRTLRSPRSRSLLAPARHFGRALVSSGAKQCREAPPLASSRIFVTLEIFVPFVVTRTDPRAQTRGQPNGLVTRPSHQPIRQEPIDLPVPKQPLSALFHHLIPIRAAGPNLWSAWTVLNDCPVRLHRRLVSLQIDDDIRG